MTSLTWGTQIMNKNQNKRETIGRREIFKIGRGSWGIKEKESGFKKEFKCYAHVTTPYRDFKNYILQTCINKSKYI